MKIKLYADSVPKVYRSLLGVFGNDSSIARAMAADVVRSLVGRSDGRLLSLVVTNRLRETLVPLFPQLSTPEGSMRLFGSLDWEKAAVNALSRLGDIIYENGVCRPAPWRLISLGATCPTALLSGTVDSEEISPSLRLTSHGYLRLVSVASLPSAIRTTGERRQGVLDWLRLDERSVSAWTSEWLDRFGTDSEPGAPLGCENTQVLVPEIRAGMWLKVAALKTSVSGIRLCRARSSLKPTKWSYFLATLARPIDEASILQSVELPSVVGSRLSFGLCVQRDSRYKVSAETRGRELVLKNLPMLPWPESTLFFAMIKDLDENGRASYSTPDDLRALLSFVFGAIGVDLEETTERGFV